MTVGVFEVSCELTRSASLGWHTGERPAKVLRTSLADDNNVAANSENALQKPQPPILRTVVSDVVTAGESEATSLESALRLALPDKEQFIPDWLKALADPLVGITSIKDVKRLSVEDVLDLPVPPMVKSLFRELIRTHLHDLSEQQMVLEATAARAREFFEPLRDRNMEPATFGSKYFQDYKNYRLILTSEEIQAGTRIAAHRIETWCKGERIVLVGILKGAFMFMSDLCRVMTRPYSTYFVEASSYHDGRTQTGMHCSSTIAPSKFIDAESNTPKKIVLIDGLLDSGKTMQDMKLHLLDNLKGTHTENDILTVCLFSKDRERVCPVADVIGIPNLPKLWLVGYGLDDRGTKRGWTELFAAPEVKIVGSIDEKEVRMLMDKLDDDAMLTAPHIFNGFELSRSSFSPNYRVSGLDVQVTHDRSSLRLQDDETKVRSKADIERGLAGVQVFKGKYEHEVLFAFIQSKTELVPEDDIFYGNNQVYAQLRCRLRKSIEVSAQRCGLPGLALLQTKDVH